MRRSLRTRSVASLAWPLVEEFEAIGGVRSSRSYHGQPKTVPVACRTCWIEPGRRPYLMIGRCLITRSLRCGFPRQPLWSPDLLSQLLVEYLPSIEVGLLELLVRPECKTALLEKPVESGIMSIGLFA